MARSAGDLFGFTRNLGFRLGLLLTIAILPIGLISIIQTLHLSRAAERAAQVALLGRTHAAAAGERALLQNAIGSADALGPAVLTTLDDPVACSEAMRSFVQSSAAFTFAGFTALDGTNRCNSGDEPGRPRDLTSSPHYQAFMQNPATLVTATSRGPLSGQSVVIVSQPLYRERTLLGYIAVSLSHDLLRSAHAMTPGTEGAHILTFNAAGQSLSSESGADIAAILPQGKTLGQLVVRAETTFAERSNADENRIFAVVSVVPGLVYALGSWSPRQTGVAALGLSRFAAVLFPLALWAVSLAVAYFAVYRLVLRHVRELRGQMRRFAIGDRSAPPPVLENAPAEIADVSETFHNMARILIRDEAAMEEAVQEKTVLLKEVHHRVKNNLQLIASIINMQSRVIDHADAKRVLRSVQDRVQSLATIYRNLYQAEHLDSVEAERLVADIIQQMSSATVATGTELRIETRLEPLVLLPDQAVPLSLLTNEAFTNAIKYAGRPDAQTPAWVRVTLERESEEVAVLRVENSLGPEQSELEGTGLGSQLIEAFAMQLEGEADVGTEAGVYRVEMRFRPAAAQHEKFRPEDSRPVVLTSKARAGARH